MLSIIVYQPCGSARVPEFLRSTLTESWPYGNVVITEMLLLRICCYYGNVVITDMLLLHGIATDMLLVLIWFHDWYATTIDAALLLICHLD